MLLDDSGADGGSEHRAITPWEDRSTEGSDTASNSLSTSGSA
eukprot:CAMPEP_0196719004 /NCGR_PEP_ID=MMETSP1091-20130531/2085_1 /TAXON_ID=302021 /ORGANISM="Rhodomonas sp., Strain CCMP768" /LENGTH=41 /DNA_ID= /DNA_START= /DNA_END= /DNA_ORIENTATION=